MAPTNTALMPSHQLGRFAHVGSPDFRCFSRVPMLHRRMLAAKAPGAGR